MTCHQNKLQPCSISCICILYCIEKDDLAHLYELMFDSELGGTAHDFILR